MPDWDRLVHAYGLATDTPGHLEALEGDDPAAVVVTAIEHLFGAVLHQGTIAPATPPAVAWLIEGLRDGRYAGGPDVDEQSREAAVLDFVGAAFASAYEAGDVETPSPEELALVERALDDFDEESFWDDLDLITPAFSLAVLELRRLAPAARAIALGMVDRAELDVVGRALEVLSQATLAAGLDPSEIADALYRWAELGSEPIRMTAVSGLGALGLDVTSYLADSPAVRLRAALALDSDGALEVLRVIAVQNAEILDYSTSRLLAERLCAAARDFDELLPVAVASIPPGDPFDPERDWGAFLLAAQRLHPSGPTESVRAFLGALVEREHFWHPWHGYVSGVFSEAGLPYDRKACARIAKGR